MYSEESILIIKSIIEVVDRSNDLTNPNVYLMEEIKENGDYNIVISFLFEEIPEPDVFSDMLDEALENTGLVDSVDFDKVSQNMYNMEDIRKAYGAILNEKD